MRIDSSRYIVRRTVDADNIVLSSARVPTHLPTLPVVRSQANSEAGTYEFSDPRYIAPWQSINELIYQQVAMPRSFSLSHSPGIISGKKRNVARASLID